MVVSIQVAKNSWYNQGRPLRQRCLCIGKIVEMSGHKPSGIKCWRILNTSVIDMRPEIMLLHLSRWLLCYHKNLSNLQLSCKEQQRHKDEQRYKDKGEEKPKEKKPRELRDWYLGTVSQDCEIQCNFLSSFHQMHLQQQNQQYSRNQQQLRAQKNPRD